MKLWEGSEQILIELIFSSDELRSLVISKLSKQREENCKIISHIHEKLNELLINNAKLFAALKLIPEDLTLVSLEEAKLKNQIKETVDMQLKLKYLIKLLQTKIPLSQFGEMTINVSKFLET